MVSRSVRLKIERTLLTDFVGTVFVISHDRYFLDRTVNRLLILEDSRLAEFTGGYSDYAAQRELFATKNRRLKTGL
jgi:ATPase subunit of ABC transporter with duplicated ATPase domains